ncbi:hypothetical protein SAMN06298216_2708 [Spirosomataceae bacterium TFI 002]|nr:hypothetical protein SAMN06298216_2708 [Spirosomataceae bacterium TFI 002]
MINDKNQKQEGGDNSTNLQAHVINLNQGITYQDAKEIATDVFKSNFIELSQVAADIAFKRVEEFNDKFLEKLQSERPNAISNFTKPSLQYALYSAQKEHAKSGEKFLMDNLINILSELTEEDERTLKYIVLEQSLLTAPKLTKIQTDILTVVFLLREAPFLGLNTLKLFDSYIQHYIQPFTENFSSKSAIYQHLIYTGCCDSTQFIGKRSLTYRLSDMYNGIFQKGFSKQEFLDKFEEETLFNLACINSLHSKELFQINPDIQYQRNTSLISNISNNQLIELRKMMKVNMMDENEMENFLFNRYPWMNEFSQKWNNHNVNSINLTSVGYSIAIANFKLKTKMKLNLSQWVSEV